MKPFSIDAVSPDMNTKKKPARDWYRLIIHLLTAASASLMPVRAAVGQCPCNCCGPSTPAVTIDRSPFGRAMYRDPFSGQATDSVPQWPTNRSESIRQEESGGELRLNDDPAVGSIDSQTQRVTTDRLRTGGGTSSSVPALGSAAIGGSSSGSGIIAGGTSGGLSGGMSSGSSGSRLGGWSAQSSGSGAGGFAGGGGSGGGSVSRSGTSSTIPSVDSNDAGSKTNVTIPTEGDSQTQRDSQTHSGSSSIQSAEVRNFGIRSNTVPQDPTPPAEPGQCETGGLVVIQQPKPSIPDPTVDEELPENEVCVPATGGTLPDSPVVPEPG
ncbi:MAG: hypothetical protein KDA91_16215, partial [Planctomycetaceae bacterium]|nr:hypothetical protein [Planctomycetaceae bacterium]